MSVDVEHVFSHGRILLSHLHNCLLPQTMRSLLCLQTWSKMGFVDDSDVDAVSRMEDLQGDDNVKLQDGWNKIDDK